MMLTPEIQSNLAAFNRALGQYASLTTKTLDEVLEKKGRDLGIKLYQEFNRHRWKVGKARSAVLAAMFRTATRLPRSAYRDGNRLTNPEGGQVPVRYPTPGPNATANIPDTTATGAKMGAWRTAVAAEMNRRKAGVGVLGASFLWYRRRSNSQQGTFFVRNSVGSPLGAVEKGPGFLRIVGYTAGLADVDLNYGIVSQALANVTDDMDEYIQRKLGEDAWNPAMRAFRAAASSTIATAA